MHASQKSAPRSSRGLPAPFEALEPAATCEVLTKGRWKAISIDEALGLHPNRLKRCPECLGALAVAMPTDGVTRPRFIHHFAHVGCSHCAGFDGRRSRHPKPLT